MDKQSFLNKFPGEDKELLSPIYDKYIVAYKTGRESYVNGFYPPNIWNKLLEFKLDVNISLDGFFDLSDRKMVIFNKEEYSNSPYTVLKIKNKSKFHKLNHSDYLGAIMALGIKRSKFGDLIIKDGIAYMPVVNEIKDYVEYNLKTVGKAPCEVEFLESGDVMELNPEVQDISVISTSMRIDCVISSITKLSRGDSESYIKQGRVMVNYSEVCEKSKEIKIGDTITIRGYGKYIIFNTNGATSSGRIKLLIKKYK